MSPNNKKRFLFVFRQAPHETLKNKEGLDFALACAAFEQDVSVLFIDDGVLQLIAGQDTKAIQSKNHSAALAALNLYGIEHCYYDQNSAQQRFSGTLNLKLLENCIALDTKAIQQHIEQHDFILHY